MNEFVAYCIKCKTRQTIKSGWTNTADSGRITATGKCECGELVSRVMPR